jgi:hypothetical protein
MVFAAGLMAAECCQRCKSKAVQPKQQGCSRVLRFNLIEVPNQFRTIVNYTNDYQIFTSTLKYN